MFKKLDFYTVAAPLALIVGFCWVYITMVYLKVPGWPAMVGMAGYYAVGGLACHERCNNGPKSIKGLLLGAVVSWIAVSIWTTGFKGDPVAMGLAMGIIVLILVLSTKWRFLGDYHFIAMPQAFLGATIVSPRSSTLRPCLIASAAVWMLSAPSGARICAPRRRPSEPATSLIKPRVSWAARARGT